MNDGLSGSAISICMVMLPESAPPGFAAVSAQMKETYGASLARSDDSERDIWSAEGVEEMLFLMHMPGPIPNDEAANAADHYHLWSNGGKEAAAHQSHLLMTLVGVESRLQSSLLLTLATRAVLQSTQAIGVYWGNGSISNSTEMFLAISEGASEDELPLNLWCRFQLAQGEAGKIRLYTLGMQQFGEMELETSDSNWEPGDIVDFIYNVSHYLLSSEAKINDGDTVGGTAEQRISVHYQPSMLDPERQVYQIRLP